MRYSPATSCRLARHVTKEIDNASLQDVAGEYRMNKNLLETDHALRTVADQQKNIMSMVHTGYILQEQQGGIGGPQPLVPEMHPVARMEKMIGGEESVKHGRNIGAKIARE